MSITVCFLLVTVKANFSMALTRLTVGGFTQGYKKPNGAALQYREGPIPQAFMGRKIVVQI